MKKVISVIFAIIIAASCFVTAFADMDAPTFSSFTVYVSNPLGAATYQSKWDNEKKETYYIKDLLIIPYGTELEITYEFTYENELYGGCHFRDNYIQIKMSDVTLNVPKVGAESAVKMEEKSEIVIINPNGTYLHDGPAESYKKVSDKIPYGTVLEIEFGNSDYNPSWAYLSYNGISGWLYIYQYGERINGNFNVAYLISKDDGYSGKVMTVKESELLKEPYGQTAMAKIPSGKVLDFKYYYQGVKCIFAFVEYNGQKGWVCTGAYFEETTAIGVAESYYIESAEGAKLYTSPDIKNAKTIDTVPCGEVVDADYEYIEESNDGNYDLWGWYRVTYNGKTGWITRRDSDIENVKYLDFEFTTQKPVVTTEKTDSTTIAEVTEESTTAAITEEYSPAELTAAHPSTSEETSTAVNSRKMSPKAIVICCVAGAVALALTSAVSVVLINNKKNNK